MRGVFAGVAHDITVTRHEAGFIVHLSYMDKDGALHTFPLSEFLPADQAERLADVAKDFFDLYNLLRRGPLLENGFEE